MLIYQGPNAYNWTTRRCPLLKNVFFIAGEMGNRFNVRRLGARIKHQMEPVTIKIYDKFSQVLRVETTATQVPFFEQYRTVHHNCDSATTTGWAPMKETTYSLPALGGSLPSVDLGEGGRQPRVCVQLR